MKNPSITVFSALVIGEITAFTLYFLFDMHKIVGIPISILILSTSLLATLLAGWIIFKRLEKK